MSGLAGVLAGRTPSGVYRWHAAYDVADVRHAVEVAQWRFAHLDGWAVDTAAGLHEGLAAALALPEHYGRNLDALNDCLRDLTTPTVLLWDGWSPLARADRRTFGRVTAVLAEHADRLTVLLRGDGPDVDVPTLD